MSSRRALITGVGGQDGSLLAEALLADGYEVHGTARGTSLGLAEPLRGRIAVHRLDLREPRSLADAVHDSAPDEVFHLAAPTYVPASWEDPRAALDEIAGATAALLSAAAELDRPPRVVVAGSSEVFGDAGESPQHEGSPCRPASPYGVAKLAAWGLVRALRGRLDLHASYAIAYNHESPRRPERFVTRRVSRGIARIRLGLEDTLTLGDLDAVRDWSHAADVLEGMRLMAAAPRPGDYVLASGRGRTVRELLAAACAHVGLDPEGRVEVDPAFVRAAETTPRVGDPSKARRGLGWEPRISFEQLVGEMVDHDLAELSR